jgi:hypothetical protein
MTRVVHACVLAFSLAGCRYHGPTQTAVDAAHVQWSRERKPEAFQCPATAVRTGRSTFDVSCGSALKVSVWCSSNYVQSCCIPVVNRSVWSQTTAEAPTVCAQRQY